MNETSEGPFAQPDGPQASALARPPSAQRIARFLTHLGWAILLLGGGAHLAWAEDGEARSVAQRSQGEPGSVFSTIDAAAVDALAHAHHTADTRDRGRMRTGTIYRVRGGYSYSPPIRSTGTIWSARAPVLRFRLRPIDVASYVVHPVSGTNALDRANEAPNGQQRRMVDSIDPMNRPLYLLTPSQRVLRYAEQELSLVASVSGNPGSKDRARILLTDSTRDRGRVAR